MQITQPGVSPNQMTVIATLAAVLEHLEQSRVPVSPDQYLSVVRTLSAHLADAQPDDALKALFAASPATAELYENLNYEHAGLCLRTLDVALEAELSARRAIEKASV